MLNLDKKEMHRGGVGWGTREVLIRLFSHQGNGLYILLVITTLLLRGTFGEFEANDGILDCNVCLKILLL